MLEKKVVRDIYSGWTKSCKTLNPWVNHNVCWYLQVNRILPKFLNGHQEGLHTFSVVLLWHTPRSLRFPGICPGRSCTTKAALEGFDFPVNTNRLWFQPWSPSGAKWISSTHRMCEGVMFWATIVWYVQVNLHNLGFCTVPWNRFRIYPPYFSFF